MNQQRYEFSQAFSKEAGELGLSFTSTNNATKTAIQRDMSAAEAKVFFDSILFTHRALKMRGDA